MKKKQKIILKGLLKSVVLILPMFLAFIGYKLNGMRSFDAAYSGFQTYFANVAADTPVVSRIGIAFIEIGRWTAPAVSLLIGISVIVELVNGQLWPRVWSKFPGHYVVYGDEEQIKKLGIESGRMFSKYCVMENRGFIGCGRYILLFDSDHKNLEFYSNVLLPRIRENENTAVYMNLHEMSCQDIQDRHLITFQINEYIADKFFQSREWIKYAYQMAGRGEPFKIALVGFEDLGKRMLEAALTLNIVSSGQHVEYYVMGCADQYISMHSQLNNETLAPDKILFTNREWWEDIPLLETADCVILCSDQETNIRYLSDILRLTTIAGTAARVYIYAENDRMLEMMQIRHFGAKGSAEEEGFLIGGDKGRLFAFRLEEKEDFLDRILLDKSFNDEIGRRKARDYIEHYVAYNAKDGYDTYDWDSLNSYLRWDNVLSGYLDEIRAALQELYQVKVDSEESGRLEHIRWERSHYLNNWKYDAQRNDRLKRHHSLKNYQDLSEEEKKKDINFQKRLN